MINYNTSIRLVNGFFCGKRVPDKVMTEITVV